MELGEFGAAPHGGAPRNLVQNGQEPLDRVNTWGWSGAFALVFAASRMQPLNDVSLRKVMQLEAGNALNEKQHA